MDGAVLHIPASVECYKSDEGRQLQPMQKHKHKPSAQEFSFLRSIVLYKDAELIIINKPHGLAVQGGTSVGKNLDSLMDAALSYDYIEGPRLVHRLDKDTSGLMVLGRTHQSTIILHELLRAKTVAASSNIEVSGLDRKSIQRSYWALVIGIPQKNQGFITVPLVKGVLEDGKFEKIRVANNASKENVMEAITEYQVLGPSLFGCTWLELRPLTGRKHQLRVHCAEALGTPIVGDKTYGWQINRDWSEQLSIKTSRLAAIKNKLSDTDLQGQCKGKLAKGSILSRKPLLHLHCRWLTLPKCFETVEFMEKQDAVSTHLEFVAPLPPHMETSWGIQPVPGIVV
ncbi:hypothetical protein O6H91_Y144100 [Diphasiastrum complanatum]|nr:hypothetical protein O6H91_Y144100 [Diphasiastrum complanatum]KAJ7296110.1 hypothetical protein O6H91_Y144100 [Diphasiastrum complanatum]